MPEQRYDIAIIGAGIVGLATAMEMLTRFPSLRLVVLEKEQAIGQHQTGHNSGVIHSGVYYAPGSLKARACVAGKARLISFCDEHGIRYDLCVKVIVATHEQVRPRRGDVDGAVPRDRACPSLLHREGGVPAQNPRKLARPVDRPDHLDDFAGATDLEQVLD